MIPLQTAIMTMRRSEIDNMDPLDAIHKVKMEVVQNLNLNRKRRGVFQQTLVEELQNMKEIMAKNEREHRRKIIAMEKNFEKKAEKMEENFKKELKETLERLKQQN